MLLLVLKHNELSVTEKKATNLTPSIFIQQSTKVVQTRDFGAVMETRVLQRRSVKVCTVTVNLKIE